MRKFTVEEIKEIVSEAGLGGCVESDLFYNGIEDKELKKLWKEAREALTKIRKKLGV